MLLGGSAGAGPGRDEAGPVMTNPEDEPISEEERAENREFLALPPQEEQPS